MYLRLSGVMWIQIQIRVLLNIVKNMMQKFSTLKGKISENKSAFYYFPKQGAITPECL